MGYVCMYYWDHVFLITKLNLVHQILVVVFFLVKIYILAFQIYNTDCTVASLLQSKRKHGGAQILQSHKSIGVFKKIHHP